MRQAKRQNQQSFGESSYSDFQFDPTISQSDSVDRHDQFIKRTLRILNVTPEDIRQYERNLMAFMKVQMQLVLDQFKANTNDISSKEGTYFRLVKRKTQPPAPAPAPAASNNLFGGSMWGPPIAAPAPAVAPAAAPGPQTSTQKVGEEQRSDILPALMNYEIESQPLPNVSCVFLICVESVPAVPTPQ